MQVTTHQDLAEPSLIDAWERVLAATPEASAFQGPVWLEAWARLRGAGPTIVRSFAASPGDDPIGIVAEVDLGNGRRSIAGGRDVTDYRGPLAPPDSRDEVAAAWIASLAADGVTELDLHGIAADTGWLDALAKAGVEAGWDLVDRAVEDVCPQVDLRGDTPDAWLDRIDGKERHELRRKSRKFARDLGGMQVVEVPAGDLLAAIDRFWEMAVTSEGDKGSFFQDPEMRTFFEDVAQSLAATSTMRIHELLAGGLPAASMISIVTGTHWGLYNSSLDQTLTAFAPGTVLAAALADLAAEQGFEVFDFLRGDEAYKYRFGAVDRPIEQARLVRH